MSLNLDTATVVREGRSLATGEGVAMHHVRAHLRLKLGKVEMVRPHWRGDPSRGIVLHRRQVRRAEDEAGEWSGGLLPPPQRLDELTPHDPDDA